MANSSDITTMPAYSASRKKANRSPVYSVQAPMTSSASATGMSNGGRCSSATAATRKTTAPGSCHSIHHGDQRSVSVSSDSEPPARAIDATASTIGSS